MAHVRRSPTGNSAFIHRLVCQARASQAKPSATFAHVAQRYDTCEDLANLLTDHAHSQQFKQGGHTDEVLLQCMAGLLCDDSGVNAAEARWVVFRLAELLNWPSPTMN